MIRRVTTQSVLLAAAMALCAPVLHAQGTRDVKVSGMGVRKCAEWQQWKESRNGELRAMTMEWAQGFIAGHNVYARGGETSNAVVADPKILIPLFDNYCQRDPEMRLLAVIMEITQSLGGSKVTIKPKQALPPMPGGTPDRNNPGRES
jgi:hypothetical protein